MISVLYVRDKIFNRLHKFGEAQIYYPVQVIFEDGRMLTALFTEAQVQAALDRSFSNEEDLPPPKKLSWWRRLLFGVI